MTLDDLTNCHERNIYINKKTKEIILGYGRNRMKITKDILKKILKEAEEVLGAEDLWKKKF